MRELISFYTVKLINLYCKKSIGYLIPGLCFTQKFNQRYETENQENLTACKS